MQVKLLIWHRTWFPETWLRAKPQFPDTLNSSHTVFLVGGAKEQKESPSSRNRSSLIRLRKYRSSFLHVCAKIGGHWDMYANIDRCWRLYARIRFKRSEVQCDQRFWCDQGGGKLTFLDVTNHQSLTITLQNIWFISALVGRRGSVVACATYKRQIAGSIPGCAELNMFQRCVPRQGTLLTRALSRPRSKWVPSRTVKACVFE